MSEEELNQMSNNELVGIIKSQRFEIKQLEDIRKETMEYIKDKQKIQYKFALSHIECDDLLNILNKGE